MVVPLLRIREKDLKQITSLKRRAGRCDPTCRPFKPTYTELCRIPSHSAGAVISRPELRQPRNPIEFPFHIEHSAVY